jgi:hypothetical protein
MALSLPEARAVVERERRECVAEAEAFRSFRDAVTDLLDPDPATSVAGTGQSAAAANGRPPALLLDGTGNPPSECTRIRDVYRRSVMAVDHVDDDESPLEHLGAELGSDLAHALRAAGSASTVGRRPLLDRIDVAVNARESFVEVLDREADSLDTVEATCDRLRDRVRRARAWEASAGEIPLDAAIDTWETLDGIMTALDEAATDRQATLTRHRRAFTVVDDDLTEYLYGERPGLAAIASVGRQLTAGRRAVVAVIGWEEHTADPGSRDPTAPRPW